MLRSLRMRPGALLVSVVLLASCGGSQAKPGPPLQGPPSQAPPSQAASSSEAASSPRKEEGPNKNAKGWAGADAETRERIATFADDYLGFLGKARTTRQSGAQFESMAREAGARDWNSSEKSAPGDLLLWKSPTAMALLRIGTAPANEGMNVLLASYDAAIIRLTPKPVYEASGLALFDTSILGTLELESWLHTPLALSLYRGATANTPARSVTLGDEPGEPVFTIPDLLPHLSRKVQRAKLIDSPERLDVVAGQSAKAVHKALKSAGFAHTDLSAVEATLLPAGAAVYVGPDHGLVAAPNQAGRAAAYAAVRAFLESERPLHSTLLILSGNDQQFYAAAGPEARVQRLLAKAVGTVHPKADALELRRILAASRALLFDHNKGSRNQGVVLNVRRDDASPKVRRRMIERLKGAGAQVQVSQEAGWSQAREVANLDMDSIALGLPVTGKGRPYELLSAFDLYQARLACSAWITQ